jgi:cobalt-zinc-cadmium efflux system outer membrane protein
LAVALGGPGSPASRSSCGLTRSPDADDGGSFALDEVVAAIDATHPRLQAAAMRSDAAEADAIARGLWTNPQLSGQWDRSIGYTTYTPRTGYFQVQASQWIEVGAPRARRIAGRIEARAVRLDRDQLRRALIGDAFAATIGVALARHRLDVLAQAREQLGAAQTIVERRIAAGAAPDAHRLRLEVLAADLEAMIDNARGDLAGARRDLDVALGPASARVPGVPSLDLCAKLRVPTAEGLKDGASRRPDLLALGLRRTAADAGIRVARREIFSGVGLTFGTAIGGGYDPATRRQQVDVIAGVALPLPFIDRGQGTLPAARARAAAASRDREAALRETDASLLGLERELRARRRAQQRLVEVGLPRARALLDVVLAGYHDGAFSVLELVDALVTLRDTRLELAELAAAARLAEGRLLDTAGLLGTGPRR